MVAQSPPSEVASLLELLGNIKPSASTLARLPAKLSERWEQYLEPFEYILADNFQVPANALTVAASLDGEMMTMKDGKRQEKRDKGAAEGKRTRGLAGKGSQLFWLHIFLTFVIRFRPFSFHQATNFSFMYPLSFLRRIHVNNEKSKALQESQVSADLSTPRTFHKPRSVLSGANIRGAM